MHDNKNLMPAGRLAFREEAGMWNCYYAKPGTMDGALLLNSIRMALISDRDVREACVDMMKLAASNIFGAGTHWCAPTAAPEHERTGRA